MKSTSIAWLVLPIGCLLCLLIAEGSISRLPAMERAPNDQPVSSAPPVAAETAAMESPLPEDECPVSCDDFNPCTVDSCNTLGICAHLPQNCDDRNVCTVDACTPSSINASGFACTHTPSSGLACDDLRSCTTGDVCNSSGQCRGTIPPPGTSCDDGDPCTLNDFCDTIGFCQGTSASLGTPCDVQGDCFEPGTCGADGKCAGAARAAGTTCDDRDPCTSADICYSFPLGLCRGEAMSCEDGDPCTRNRCEGGQCLATATDCEDGNPCTVNSCNPSSGGCELTFATGACEDGNFCSTGDFCSGGNCVGSPRNCDDGVACTDDHCSTLDQRCEHFRDDSVCGPNTDCATWFCAPTAPGGCSVMLRTGPCPSPNRCYEYGRCDGAICRPWTEYPVTCNDSDACTFDSCDPAIGCVFNPRDCSDGSLCTTDSCNHSTGECFSTPVACDDQNPCTDDSCGAATGCAHSNNTQACDDGNRCTTGDACSNGSCAGAPLSCDDGVACTQDSCDPTNGCVQVPLDESCDEGNTCTLDYCDATLGCQRVDLGAGCTDEDPCTADSCDPTLGCVFTPLPGSIQVTLSPSAMSPANHQLVSVVAIVRAVDGCGAPLPAVLTSIVSSEPDDAAGSGDGRTTNDIQGASYGTADSVFQLRAERSAHGPGRTYRVTYTATVTGGPPLVGTASVVVPR